MGVLASEFCAPDGQHAITRTGTICNCRHRRWDLGWNHNVMPCRRDRLTDLARHGCAAGRGYLDPPTPGPVVLKISYAPGIVLPTMPAWPALKQAATFLVTSSFGPLINGNAGARLRPRCLLKTVFVFMRLEAEPACRAPARSAWCWACARDRCGRAAVAGLVAEVEVGAELVPLPLPHPARSAVTAMRTEAMTRRRRMTFGVRVLRSSSLMLGPKAKRWLKTAAGGW